MKKLVFLLFFLPIFCLGQVNLDNNFVRINKGDSSMTILDGKVYQNGDSLYLEMNDSLFLLNKHIAMGGQHLTVEDTTNCATAGVFYKVNGTWADGVDGVFVPDGSGLITYTGNYANVLIIGVSDLTCSDNTATITYGFYRNGALITGWVTPTRFENVTNYQHISITGITTINKNDTFQIYCSSDNTGTIVTHHTLYLSFICDR